MPAGLPRLLCIMGSGETSPTMTSVHGDLLGRLGPPPVPAVLLDTPFGFQENASEISAKAVAYFRDSVGAPIGVASYRSAAVEPLEYETMLARVRGARYVFAGPGSPSYAVRQWAGSRVRDVIAEKLRSGGCVTFSSAAACTLGRFALPVYEIYKVGVEPHWLDGIDLLAEIGLVAAVVPHYDNAEGGTHDTRHCYMGDRRLRLLEEQLPEEASILGVDEHTACIVDLDAATVTVRGRGAVTLRRRGAGRCLAGGESAPLAWLFEGGDTPVDAGSGASDSSEVTVTGRPAGDPFWEGVEERRHRFDAAIATGHVDEALAAILALETHMTEWASDTLDSDGMDRARSLLRSMIVRLGDLAQLGARDPRGLVAPFVEAVLEQRARARSERRFADADAFRDALAGLGVEVRDGRDGSTEWSLPPGYGTEPRDAREPQPA